MKKSKYPKIPQAATFGAGSYAGEMSWGFFFKGINWEMDKLERFNPYDPKQSLTFPRNDSIKRKEQGLEILLVSADRAGSPTRYDIWMTGLFIKRKTEIRETFRQR